MTELSGLLTSPSPDAPPAGSGDLDQIPPAPPAPPAAPWYRQRRWLIALAALAAAALAAAAVAVLGRGGDSGVIDLPDGRATVESFAVDDQYPTDCSPGPGCWEAAAGYELVSVELLTEGDAELSGASLAVAGGESYETSIETTSIVDGSTGSSATLTFAVPVGSSGYVLHLPGADPFELEG